MKIHGKEYTEVKDRLREFWTAHPDWSIFTELVWHSEAMGAVCFKASIISKDDSQIVTGFAYEERLDDSKQVNFAAWVENCETSAIGRALANLGYQGGSNERPSAEEMDKVERAKSTPPKAKTDIFKSVDAKIKDVVENIKQITKTDQFYLQALENRGVKDTSTMSPAAKKELLDALNGFWAYLDSLSPEDEDELKEESLGKKYLLL